MQCTFLHPSIEVQMDDLMSKNEKRHPRPRHPTHTNAPYACPTSPMGAGERLDRADAVALIQGRNMKVLANCLPT